MLDRDYARGDEEIGFHKGCGGTVCRKPSGLTWCDTCSEHEPDMVQKQADALPEEEEVATHA